MKIEIINFFDKEYKGPKGGILFMSLVGGLSFVLLLAIINQGAAAVAEPEAEAETILCVMFLITAALTVASKHYTLNRSLKIVEESIRKVRVRLIDKLRHTELRFLENTDPGEIYARIVQDTQLISQISPTLVNAIDAAFSSLGVFAYIAFISVPGFLLTLLLIIAMHAIFFLSYGGIKDDLNEARKKEGDFLNALDHALSGFKEIKINSKKNDALFADIEALSLKSQQVKTHAEIAYDKTVVLFLAQYVTALAVIAFVMPLFGHIHGGALVKIVTAMLFIMGMLGIVFRGIYAMVKMNVAAENLKDLEARIEAFSASSPESVFGSDPVREFREISFDSVSFRYTGRQGETLFEAGPFDLTIRQGELLFIVGGNGSGKSTMMKLLTGLYRPTSGDGRITLDGQPLTRKNRQSYRELFSVIFTDFHLFRKLYGVESAEEQEVRGWLKEMDVHRKTDYAGGRFTNTDLSTGQRKRLAYIAAILEDKPVYVFDEWAADQDPVFRRHFYDKLLEDLRAMDKTVIAVSHDDRFFDRADRVIRLEEGRIAEETFT